MTQVNPYQSAPVVDQSQVQLVGDLPEITIKWLFFSSSGRIPRRGLWFGTCGLGIVALLAAVALALIENATIRLSSSPDQMVLLLRVLASNVLALLVWCECTLISKRCHDRNRSEGRVFVWLLPVVLLMIISAFLNDADVPLWAWMVMAFVLFLAFIDLALLRGTRGPNRFGLDPTDDLRFGAVTPRNPAFVGSLGENLAKEETCPFCEAKVIRTRWDTCPQCERPI